MNNNTQQQEINVATILLIGVCVLMLICGLIGCTESREYGGIDRSSSDYRYVEKRMALEGMSQKDARQAADAVMKFHEAQKARQR